jgi:hypothetical protein
MSSEPQGADGARLVSLANEEAVKEILATTVLDLWKVVNNLCTPQKFRPRLVDSHGASRRDAPGRRHAGSVAVDVRSVLSGV